MASLPLLRGFAPDAPFAYRHGAAITVRQFLHHAHALARALPESGFVLNVCRDRYRFTVGFAAALLRRQVTLMPPSQTADMLDRLRAIHPGLYRLTDGDAVEDGIPTIRVPERAPGNGEPLPVPLIDGGQTAAVMFTSGSTAEPIAHAKTWETLVASGTAEAARLGLEGSRAAVLGTVPPQHMYGLESTVLMPLQAGLAIHGWMPFYAADVCTALEELPRPRVLVSTPVHLRTLVFDADSVPAVDLIVCATAPLMPQLAAKCETRFAAPLHEIYGCTEAGQIATRRTVESPAWRALPGLRLRQDEKGTWVRGGHVTGEILLHDVIELKDSRDFLLHGRNADLVNIAGKRTSLAHLNYHLNSIEGVRDGVFVVPDTGAEAVARLMAFVVAPGLTRDALLRELRARIDPAFMPRPLKLVPELPRNATGKLPRAAVLALAAETIEEE